MRQLLHLARRFFGSLAARRPGPDDQRRVAQALTPDQAGVFWEQSVPDLDHAVRMAVVVEQAAPNRPDLVRAALLHDIGKRHAHLGTFGRSIVTALAAVRLPVGRRGRAYLDHGRTGSQELAALGSEEIVVGFAAHHPGPCPSGLDPADWAILAGADDE